MVNRSWVVDRGRFVGRLVFRVLGNSFILHISHIASITAGVSSVGHCLGATIREQNRVGARDNIGI